MLLVVSLDSESLGWLDEHIEAGHLPNLRSVVRSGVRFPIQVPYFEGSGYPTVYSGIGAAGHGIYFPFQWYGEDQRVRVWGLQPFPRTIFERADEAGARVVILDLPECPGFALKNGFAVSGLQFRTRALLGPWTTDAEQSSRLQAHLGEAPVLHEVFGQPYAPDLARLREILIAAPARLNSAARYVLRGESPDCLWVNFVGMHVAAHQFFNLGLLKDRKDRQALESTRLDVARGYDRMLGELMDGLPAGSTTLLFYDKGMGDTYGWSDLLAPMLRSIMGTPGGDQPVWRLRSLVPQPVRARIASVLADETVMKFTAHLATPRADWSRTRAFALPSEGLGFIRFNLRGRERDGIVNQSEVAGLTAEIREGLKLFTDLDGEPCVTQILTRDEVLRPGTHADRFPDLLVDWSMKPTLLGQGVRSPRSGIIRRQGVGTGRSGAHCAGAMAVIMPGRCKLNAPDGAIESEDIPPTFLSALGLPADDLVGRALLAKNVECLHS